MITSFLSGICIDRISYSFGLYPVLSAQAGISAFVSSHWWMGSWNAQYGEAIAIIPFIGLILYMIFATRPERK